MLVKGEIFLFKLWEKKYRATPSLCLMKSPCSLHNTTTYKEKKNFSHTWTIDIYFHKVWLLENTEEEVWATCAEWITHLNTHWRKRNYFHANVAKSCK